MTGVRTSAFRFLLALLFIGAFVLDPVRTAAALQPEPQGETSLNLVEHLRTYIRSDDSVLREYALVDVTTLANCRGSCSIKLQTLAGRRLRIQNNTYIRTMVDLNGLVPDLLWAYGTGPSDGLRILALSGLLRIGNEASLELLISARRDVSPFVERVTQRGIATFFVERYPHLRPHREASATISLADIRRARGEKHDVALNP